MESGLDRETASQSLEKSKQVLRLLAEKQKISASSTEKEKPWHIRAKDLFLYQVKEITYEDKAPSREAMENILGAFKGIDGISFIYMILGDRKGVRFYLGVARDRKDRENSLGMEINDIGTHILERSIRGNFRGCRLKKLEPEEKEEVLEKLSHPAYAGILEGVPSIEKSSRMMTEGRDFQGTDRLIDVMSGDEFGYVVIARPYTEAEMDQVEKDLYTVYDLLMPLAKRTLQRVDSLQDNESSSSVKSDMNQYSKGTSTSDSDSHQHTENRNVTDTKSQSRTRQDSNSKTSNYQNNQTDSASESTNHSDSDGGQYHRDEKSSGSSQSCSVVKTDSHGTQESDSFNSSFSRNQSYVKGTSETNGYSHSVTENDVHNLTSNSSSQKGKSTSKGYQLSEQLPVEQREAMDWKKYIDEVLLPRLDNGRGKGLFLSCAYLFVNDSRAKLYRLANTAISLFSGTKGNRAALRFQEFAMNDEVDEEAPLSERLRPEYVNTWQDLSNLQIPDRHILSAGKNEEAVITAQSGNRDCRGDWLSSDELGILTGFPQKEVIGLKLRKEVDFGLNVSDIPEEDRIELGKLVQCGEEKTPVYLDRRDLDKHMFIAGTTGSGKTTTCQNILLDCDMPFLVIEPVKSEYRALKEQCPDIIYFTPGNQKVAPFFLNPFELFPGESISARADMLKASMEASFHMEAAIPQILESAIYRAYEEKGWDVNADTWHGKTADDKDGPFCPYSNAFPTFADFAEVVKKEIRDKGFDERLRDEYLGTINSMTASLLVGSKGQMLNTPKSVNFYDLVTRKVVIELDEIKTGSEKSLLMGFILTNLLAAVKARHEEAKKEGREFRHITLVEEAHRLLSRYMPGDSLNKKQGVEVFADMLAEVRKYGESMMIVDQIPDKMTPEVLKNTNTKIVHRLFAQDDKEAMGNTMALDQDQMSFLSNLVAGRAIVFSQGWSKAVQVQVKQATNTTGKEVPDEEIQKAAYRFYGEEETLDSGVLFDLRIRPVTEEIISQYFKILRHSKQGGDALYNILDPKYLEKEQCWTDFVNELERYQVLGAETLARVYKRYMDQKEQAAVNKESVPALCVELDDIQNLIRYVLEGSMEKAERFLRFLQKKEFIMNVGSKILGKMNRKDIHEQVRSESLNLKEFGKSLAELKTDVGLDDLTTFLYESLYDWQSIIHQEGKEYDEEARKELKCFLNNLSQNAETAIDEAGSFELLKHNWKFIVKRYRNTVE